MKGKIGLVVGLGVGYVLGTRAGRERYEQIKTQWLKVWHLDPVQAQVGKVREFAKSQAAAVPQALWNGAVKVVKAVNADGTPGQKVDSALSSGKGAVEDLKRAVEDTVDAAEDGELDRPAKTSSAKKTTASATKKSTGSTRSAKGSGSSRGA
ncbi:MULTISPECIES: hypothetical protein [Microbacterium]|uniref:hypothetical protein n=1 Tax=Microbacterium TaxID=33882 RepID=UPI00082D9211|nr:hypothetical protein [Microbacterium resistens]MBW1638846.1 hypothetical protein [Microbacterium resistens]